MYGKRKAFAIGCGILLVLSVGLNIAQLGKIETLSGQVKNLEYAQIQNEYRFNEINNQLGNLSSGISAGNSLLSSSETTVSIDENKQLTATVSVIPKEIGPEDTIYVSIGELKEEAVPDGTAYTAALTLTEYNNFAPCITILSPDGTQKQETLDNVSPADYCKLYYAFDISQNNGQTTIHVGLQTSGECVLSIPRDIEKIWIHTEDSSTRDFSVPMTPDGDRIPETAGYTSAPASDLSGTEATAISDMYYSYFAADLDGLPQSYGDAQFVCEFTAAGGLTYKIYLGTLSAGGGGGSLYPDWEE